MPQKLPEPAIAAQHPTALAPMQDITTLSFMKILTDYGAPDYFFTEYFRVHAHSKLEPHILASIEKNPSNRPVFAQLIGENLVALKRAALELQHYPIAGIDLNLGCPAPRVYRKNVGGGLLRDPKRVDGILACLRENHAGLLTVKMRVGFEDLQNFEALLECINKNQIDLLSLHARTVRQSYRPPVHYDCIARAVGLVRCPVMANGDISSAKKAQWVLDTTGAHGLMVGRHAIGNPWIFRQIREHQLGQTPFVPSLKDVHRYIEKLWEATCEAKSKEANQLGFMKKFINFIGPRIDAKGLFLKEIRHAREAIAFFEICERWLLEGSRAELPLPAEPYPKIIARPNCEAPVQLSIA